MSKQIFIDIETDEFLDSLRHHLDESGLTDEQKTELEELTRQRLLVEKNLKLEAFKQIPAELRQQVIDKLLITKHLHSINTISAPLSDREQLLQEREDRYNRKYRRFALKKQPNSRPIFNVDYSIHLEPTDVGISLDDLLAAHTDATVDEEVLKP
jgi:hypothetical protein